MATPITLASGLGGAIGCDFRQPQNQLVFVEYSGNLSRLNIVPGSPVTGSYAVLGNGYSQPEDVKVSADDLHAFVTERTGDLVKVLLTAANRSSATVIASGMTAPQQLFLDEAHNAAYTVEYANPGHLWHINLTTGVKTSLFSTLDQPIGLVLSDDLQYAYVSEQTTGPALGQISQIQLSSGTRTILVTGLTNPFYLTWADAGQSTLLVAERDPANRITSINIAARTATVVVPGVAARPSSVAVPNTSLMLICCNSVIEAVPYGTSGLQPTGPLLIGIGFIPFTAITGGLATTASGYFYPVTNVPFGGTLPLMINYQRALTDGCAYYRVFVDGNLRTDSWSDYFWNGTTYVLTPVTPQTVGGQPGFFPVRPAAQLFLWMNPTLGMLMDSTNLGNSSHTIVIEFSLSTGVLKESSTPLSIIVNNQSCTATLTTPVLSGVSADPLCGLLHYGTNKTLPVTMAFTASQPAGYATFSFSLVKGVNGVTLTPPPPTGGPVITAVSPFSGIVSTLLSNPAPNPPCTIAGFAEELYVAATINNGWGRQSQYDASASLAFVLAP